MALSSDRLRQLDQRGYVVLDAITRSRPPNHPTYASPHGFVCVDNHTYWVKGQAQRGLACELIAGRLADAVGAGPIARVVRVPAESLPADGSANGLIGVNVGIKNVNDAENARDLAPLLASTQFHPAGIDAASRALVVVFQAWVGAGDPQVLVNLKTGQVMSIDHGDCFSAAAPPLPTAVDIPGVPPDVGRDAAHVAVAVGVIQAVSDEALLEAVAHVPEGTPWSKPQAERLAIAEYLAERRDRIGEVMKSWLP